MGIKKLEFVAKTHFVCKKLNIFQIFHKKVKNSFLLDDDICNCDLKVLNGGDTISPNEREDAERAFIRYYFDTDPEKRPARFEELVQVHVQYHTVVTRKQWTD